MSVDIFGRLLVSSKEVSRGPPGIGFTLTETGDYDLESKRLCNIGSASGDNDAINLYLLNLHTNSVNQSLKDLHKDITNSLETKKERIEVIYRSIEEDNKIKKTLEENYKSLDFKIK